jgi:hypothetical protein
LRQKDTDARWTLKIGGKVRYREDGTSLPMIALSVFGYKSHISIDRRFGFIREMAATSASAAGGKVKQSCPSNTRALRGVLLSVRDGALRPGPQSYRTGLRQTQNAAPKS